jgi:hypothetical protein
MINDAQIFEVLNKMYIFLFAASKRALENGYFFASCVQANADDVSWTRKKVISLRKFYEERKLFSPKQRSYALHIIGKIHDILETFENPELLAIIKTKVGFLEISQNNKGEIVADIVKIDTIRQQLELSRAAIEDTSIVQDQKNVPEQVWNLSWLDDLGDFSSEEIKIKLQNPMIQTFINSGIISKIIEFFLKSDVILKELNMDTLNKGIATEIIDSLGMKMSFVVKSEQSEKILDILKYVYLHRTGLQSRRIQQDMKNIHDNIFGGMFDTFSFLENIVKL